jgi:hypothetical protein
VKIGIAIGIEIDWMTAVGKTRRWQATALQRSLRDQPWEPSRFINLFNGT